MSRFKQLEEEFNLGSLESDLNDADNNFDEITDALANAKYLDKNFKKMDHFSVHDQEMDELAKLAVESHKELQELGMNVEIRHAGEIFSSSSQMLKIAVDAKNLKVEKKLKLLKLQLDKLKIDNMTKNNEDDVIDGNAMMLDRNQLLNQLKSIDTESKA